MFTDSVKHSFHKIRNATQQLLRCVALFMETALNVHDVESVRAMICDVPWWKTE